jgi:hypothetical protein
MKKTTIISLATVLGMFMFAMPAMAATVASLSPASINVTAGKSFTVSVAVDPQGASNYAEKLEVDFPASELEVTSFSLENSWMALTQSGYDSIDNGNGVLLKTAGYPGGLSGATQFGTITFYAKTAGSGTIKIGNSSLSFAASSQSAITGNGTSVTVSAVKTIAPTKVEQQTIPTVEEQPAVQEPVTAAPAQEIVHPVLNMQAAASTAADSSNNVWLWILVAAVILLLVVWFIYRRNSTPKQ